MSRTDRDVTRVVQSWLEEGVTALPDRVLDTVLDQLPTTPQRRSRWAARRRPNMNNSLRIGLAAAAVVVIAFIGYQLVSGSNVGGPGPAETPTPLPTGTAAPSPAPAADFPPAGALAIGRHALIRGGVPFSFELPTADWSSSGNPWINKDAGVTPEGAAMLFWNPDPDNVFADPCARTALSPPAGPTAADLAAAMSSVPGTDLVSGPSDVTVGGYPAKLVVLTVREDIACSPTGLYLWYFEDEAGELCGGELVCGRYATALGDTIRVWIVDVDGERIVIEGETYRGAGPEVEQEIQQIVASIRFE